MISAGWQGSVAGERRRAAFVLVVSAILVGAVAVAVYLFDAELSGVRPSFGDGVSPSLGNRVVADFLVAQEAEARALSSGDQSQLEGRLTGNALQDVAQQMSTGGPAAVPTTVTFRPQSLTVVQARDPNDPSVVIEVQEDGVRTVVSTPLNAAPSEQVLSFHGDFWMRESGGRFAITDQAIDYQQPSPLPAIAVAAAALLAVGIATILVLRSRASAVRAASMARAPTMVTTSTRSIAVPADGGKVASTQLVVRTFGGLHLLQGGKDWVQAPEQRQVTGFVWQRLLLGAIRDPAYRPTREQLARQVSPILDRQTQLKRMRNVVLQLRELPAPLKDCILIESQALSFRLDACDVDAVNLLKAGALAAGRPTLGPAETQWAQRVFEETAGTFLPDFEKVEDLATDRHPMCTDLVNEIRGLLATKRADVAVLLADTYLGSGQSGQAISVLEPVVRDHPKRKDLADRLATAFRSAGRDAEAEALADRFA